jgi:hypothetical protein
MDPTNTGGVAVVTTTLAQTDRRALSQAWYSALHLAEGARPRAGLAPVPSAPRAASPSSASPAQHASSAARNAKGESRVVRRVAEARVPGTVPERRTPPAGLDRRIAGAVARRGARTGAHAATVAIAGARIHVLVRTQAGATRIVALCPPVLAGRVARALAQARFALAAQGLNIAVGS